MLLPLFEGVCIWPMRGSRGGAGGPDPPPLKNHKIKGFLVILVWTPENHKATKPAFNVGPSSARQRNAIGPPLTKLSGSTHVALVLKCSTLVFFLVLQSSRRGRQSLLIYLYGVLAVMRLLVFFVSSSQCRGWSVIVALPDHTWFFSGGFRGVWVASLEPPSPPPPPPPPVFKYPMKMK